MLVPCVPLRIARKWDELGDVRLEEPIGNFHAFCKRIKGDIYSQRIGGRAYETYTEDETRIP